MASSSRDELAEALNEEFDNLSYEELDTFLYTYNDCVAAPRPKKNNSYERHREEGHIKLWTDYLAENETFTHPIFRHRFGMNNSLFIRIVNGLSNNIPLFQQKRDATGRYGFSALQKCTTTIHILAYGCPADAVDEYLRIVETTSLKCMEYFVNGIISCFGDEYLRKPTAEDLQRLLTIGELRGFPDMIGSIDCMHWEWKNCPTAWKGQYSRGFGKPMIVLEAVASQDLWIWHAFLVHRKR